MTMKYTNVLVKSDGKEYKNNFSLYLQNIIRDVRTIEVVSAAIINSSYNVETNISDKIYLYADGNLESSSIFVTVPEGNYSITQLTSYIQNTLNAMLALGTTSWVVIYNTINYKVKISSSVQFHLSNKRGLPLLFNLGFDNSQILPSNSFISDNVVRLNPPRAILLQFDNIAHSGLDIPESYNGCHFILPLFSASGSTTFLNYNDMKGQKLLFNENSVDLDRLNIKLYSPDKNRELFSIHSDWSLLLRIGYEE